MKLRSQKAMYFSPISILSVLTIKKSTCKKREIKDHKNLHSIRKVRILKTASCKIEL